MADRTVLQVVVKHWPDIAEHLDGLLKEAGRRMERAETTEDMWREQGRARAYRELLNLPATLSVLAEP